MAGEARTQEFNFSDATLMVGPMADVMNLTPTAHSIGLIKNLNVTMTPTKVDLTAGIRNTKVHTTITNMEVSVATEVYEYTPKNIAYALGVEADQYGLYPNHQLAANVTGDGLTVDTFVISSTSDISAEYPVNSWILLRNDTLNQADLVFLAKVKSRVYDANYDTLTVEMDRVLPVGFNFKIGDTVCRQNQIPVGKKEAQGYVGIKIAAKLPEGGNITMIIPRAQIREGFNLSFIGDNYSNMPFVWDALEAVPSDPLYDDFKDVGGIIHLFMGGHRLTSI